MKILNFPDDRTIFLLIEINWNTRIQSILKPHEKPSSSKTNFSKIQALWTDLQKRIDKPGQMILSKLYIEKLGTHLVNSVLDNNNWDIMYDK